MVMHEELNEEYNTFLEDIERGEPPIGRYVDVSWYEDEYSRLEISECQKAFMNKVKAWLHQHRPNQYVVSVGYCVFVMTIATAREKNISYIEEHIVE